MRMGLISTVLFVVLTAACAHTRNPHYVSNMQKADRAPAQDNSMTELTHMSADGRYIGFFEEFVQDGSGSYSTTYRVLDLVIDKYIFDKRLLISDPESLTEAEQAKVPAEQRRDLMLLAKSVIANTKMVPTAVKPIADFSNLGQMQFGFNEGLTQKGNFSVSGKPHSFEITTVDATKAQIHKSYQFCIDEATAGGDSTKLYTLKVNNKVAHQDSRVPRSRGCANGYGVDKIYHLVGGKILFFIRYRTMGFEGPDFRTITVPMNSKAL